VHAADGNATKADTDMTKLLGGAAVVAAGAALVFFLMGGEDDPKKNIAFVFIKPHAYTEATKSLVRSELAKRGITITTEGVITGPQIDEKKYIDQHYYAIASKATILPPHELNVPADKFQKQFGVGWQQALDSGKVFNAMQACKKLNITADQLDKKWGACKKAGKLVKFGGGFYCGEIDGIYIFNGFFMSMRSKFTGVDDKINYFVVEWNKDDLKWADFRGAVLGPTDPAEAPADSIRGLVAANWKSLGLKAPCNVGDNAVHASASPFEALAECTNWLEKGVSSEAFGRRMLKAGISKETIKKWSVDPQVKYNGGKKSLFDLVEDLDSEECLAKLVEIGSCGCNK